MAVSKERLGANVACLYGKRAEIFETLGERFIDYEIIFEGNNLCLNWEEVEYLIQAETIECDGGNTESPEETRVYILTEVANDRIKDIVNRQNS